MAFLSRVVQRWRRGIWGAIKSRLFGDIPSPKPCAHEYRTVRRQAPAFRRGRSPFGFRRSLFEFRNSAPSVRPARFGVGRYIGLALLVVFASANSRAASLRGENAEYQLKAAFILNFARYIEWPPTAFASRGQPLVIGIVGKDPFGPNIERIVAGKNIDGHPVVVKRVNTTSPGDCHVVFIAASEKDRIAELLQPVRGSPVLTIGDTEGFNEAGGIIYLKKKQDMIRFEINLAAAEASGLKISSKLLKLADNFPAKP